MTPFPIRDRTCWGYCEGNMSLSLSLTSSSVVATRFRTLHDDMIRQASASDPIVVYRRLDTPPDYTEAYEQNLG
jgi:hypothetical protein